MRCAFASLVIELKSKLSQKKKKNRKDGLDQDTVLMVFGQGSRDGPPSCSFFRPTNLLDSGENVGGRISKMALSSA